MASTGKLMERCLVKSTTGSMLEIVDLNSLHWIHKKEETYIFNINNHGEIRRNSFTWEKSSRDETEGGNVFKIFFI